MIGPPGVDADRYPRALPDAVGLRALLAARRFDELTRHVESWQRDFEADFHKERWGVLALEAFAVNDPAVPPLLDEWVRAAPRSFAPIAARGLCEAELASSARGTRVVRETSRQALAEMSRRHAAAARDLHAALARRPKLIAVYRALLAIAAMEGDGLEARRLADAGIAACPECLSLRSLRVQFLAPRWGGSLAAMDDIARDAERWAKKNPRLRVLAGRRHAEECDIAREADRLDDAVAACDRAVAAGDDHVTLEDRARTWLARDEPAKALVDIERAVALAPNGAALQAMRADLLARAGRIDDARAVLDRVWLLDAHDDQVRASVARIIRSLHRAIAAAKSPEDKMLLVNRALEIDGNSGHALALRAGIHRAAGRRVEARRDVEAALAVDPGSYEACLELDELLLPVGELEAIIAAWTRYIELEPDDARAYLERSGTLHHAGRQAEMRADLKKACDMGHPKACAIQDRLKGLK